MQISKITFFILALLLVYNTKGQSISTNNILKISKKVADWQLENPKDTSMGDWVQGSFVNGLLALGRLPGNQKYLQAVKQIGIHEKWGVIKTSHRANDHCTPQAWIEYYEMEKQPEMIASVKQELDRNMEIVSAQDDDLTFKTKNREKWSWCDALFMSPPTYARMGKVTGEQKYSISFINGGGRFQLFITIRRNTFITATKTSSVNENPMAKKFFGAEEMAG